MEPDTEARFQRIEHNLAKAAENQVSFQADHEKWKADHEKRMAEYQARHEKWKAEWEEMQKEFAATMYGYHVRAEGDMQSIREHLQEIARNVKLLTRRKNGPA